LKLHLAHYKNKRIKSQLTLGPTSPDPSHHVKLSLIFLEKNRSIDPHNDDTVQYYRDNTNHTIATIIFHLRCKNRTIVADLDSSAPLYRVRKQSIFCRLLSKKVKTLQTDNFYLDVLYISHSPVRSRGDLFATRRKTWLKCRLFTTRSFMAMFRFRIWVGSSRIEARSTATVRSPMERWVNTGQRKSKLAHSSYKTRIINPVQSLYRMTTHLHTHLFMLMFYARWFLMTTLYPNPFLSCTLYRFSWNAFLYWLTVGRVSHCNTSSDIIT
jgi:hypothetical protein